jgi:hypothetical protein
MDSDGLISNRPNNIIQFICPTEVIQFQVKSLTFGLKRSDKKAKSFELLTKASVKMLEGDSPSKIKEGEIEKINKEEEKLKKLEKEEDNKFPCCFEGFLRHKCLLCWCICSIIISLAIATVISIALMAIILMSFDKMAVYINIYYLSVNYYI